MYIVHAHRNCQQMAVAIAKVAGERRNIPRYLAYLAALREFARFKGVPFIDPTDGNPHLFDDSEYSDHCHMRPKGAKQLTSILAARIDLRGFPNSTGRRAATLRESAPDLGEVGKTVSNHDADTATLK